MRLHKLLLVFFALSLTFTATAQQDNKAREVLDRVSATYSKGDGVKISFKGTQRGTLWVKGNRFVLECAGIKSWFDGTTQWSYVEENEEVNISSPTPEEVQVVNPYVLVNMYKKGFNYRYVGTKKRYGKEGQEVILLPYNNQEVRQIILNVGADNIPFYIGIDMQNGHYEEFISTAFEKVELNDTFFQFQESQYPNAEVIDLR